jgi:acylphosphatase
MAEICVRAIVEGRVQGVSFRDNTRRQAMPLNVTGHAKNRPDGTVEVLACGEESAVNQLVDWLHKGPPAASVNKVTVHQEDQAPPASFTTG